MTSTVTPTPSSTLALNAADPWARREALDSTGCLHYSTSLTRCFDSKLMVGRAEATWENYGPAEHFDDGAVLAHATVWAYDGITTSVCDPDFRDVLDDLYWECDAENGDLEAAAGRLLTAFEDDGLDLLAGFAMLRWLILDSVEVQPPLRGLGLGRTIAAHALQMAGAWSTDAAIVAIAGARVENGYELDAVAYAEAWQDQAERSVQLLDALGLEYHPANVFIGHSALGSVDSALRRLAP